MLIFRRKASPSEESSLSKPREYAYAGKLEETMRLEAQAKALGKIIEKELEILGLKPNMKVLDAGCGTGAVTRRIAMNVLPEEAYGVDVDPLSLKKQESYRQRRA